MGGDEILDRIKSGIDLCKSSLHQEPECIIIDESIEDALCSYLDEIFPQEGKKLAVSIVKRKITHLYEIEVKFVKMRTLFSQNFLTRYGDPFPIQITTQSVKP